jgi:hypothetical protein
MDITNFEILDLGPAPEGLYDAWGASYRPSMTCSVVGEGTNAGTAFQDALDQLAFEGYDTKLLNESGMEMGFYSMAASTPVAQIESHVEPDEEDEADEEDDSEIVYHVGIRYEGFDEVTPDIMP